MACKECVGCTQGLCIKSNCEISVRGNLGWGSNVPNLQTSYQVH
jgi:hypothetical protein